MIKYFYLMNLSKNISKLSNLDNPSCKNNNFVSEIVQKGKVTSFKRESAV